MWWNKKRKKDEKGNYALSDVRIEMETPVSGEIYIDGKKLRNIKGFEVKQYIGHEVPTIKVEQLIQTCRIDMKAKVVEFNSKEVDLNFAKDVYDKLKQLFEPKEKKNDCNTSSKTSKS